MKQFDGKVAVVTGGGSGIGEGLSRALAEAGASVIVADIMRDDAETVVAAIRDAGGSAAAAVCDVSDRASVEAMKAEANRRFGRVSLLFANAGVTLFERLTDMADEDIDWLLQVALHGVFHCLRAFLPDMIAAREGPVVATSSFAGLLSPFMDEHAPYVAAKAGVIGLMLTMRRELADSGVGMTVLCPGKVATRITESRRRRPRRFGGPAGATVTLPLGAETMSERTPAQVAEMVFAAIRDDKPVVVTHGDAKEIFLRGFSDVVAEAFDAAAAWEATRLPAA
jgi:NAD(P)-dependent dehydrogenase (short-subunit alcohol dehydrogenase family)